MSDVVIDSSYHSQMAISGNAGDSSAATDLQDDQGLLNARDAARTLEQAEALLYEHPLYQKMKPKWQKFADLYDSDDIYKYIRRHLRESDENWNERIRRAYCYNYCTSIVDLYVAYLFSTNISRDMKDVDQSIIDDFGQLYADADLQGNSYESFMQDAAIVGQVFGYAGVLVDSPSADSDILTEQDRKSEGIRPYLTLIDPLQLLDWDCDKFGRFNWVKIELPPEEQRSYQKKVDGCERFILIWNREGWVLWSVVCQDDQLPVVRKIREGTNPTTLKEVPLVIIRNQPMLKNRFMGYSALRDIADINIALMNWSSLGDEEINNRCLNVLAMERDGQGNCEAKISHHNILEYPAGTQNPPAYLTPGETPLKLVGEWIDRARDEIYRLAKLGGSTGLAASKEATSGIAYAYEFNETNQSLSAKAAKLEEGERKIHNLVAKWLGGNFTGTITYARDFGVDDFFMELDTLMKGRAALTSPTAIKQMEKNLVSKMFARRPMKFRQQLEQEIDSSSVGPLLDESFESSSPVLVDGVAWGRQPEPVQKEPAPAE